MRTHIRRKKSGREGKTIVYQRVHSYRNENGDPRERVIEHLGTNPPGDLRPLNQVEARLVAEEAVKGKPSQEELRRLLATLEVETGPWEYERFGIDLDMLKKTLHLRLK